MHDNCCCPFDKRKSQNMIISFLSSFCVYAYMVLFARVVWGPTLAHHIIVVTSVCVGGGAVVLSEVPYCGHMPAESLSSLDQYCPTTPAQIVLSWLLAVYCTDHVPPNPQDGFTPLMAAAAYGHLPLARLLVETYHCDVNAKDDDVSGWEVIGRVSGLSCKLPVHNRTTT